MSATFPGGADAQPAGTLQPGDRVQLTDPKGRKHTVTLEPGKTFFTSKGALAHDDLLDGPEGVVVVSSKGTPYLAQRPLLSDFVLSMPRGATVIYPKDAAVIVGLADIYPGAVVVEAGAGSGALSCSLLRAVGPEGTLHSFERREDFAEVAAGNVAAFFGEVPSSWHLRIEPFGQGQSPLIAGQVDRVVLDMLAPWDCLEESARVLRPGGVLCCYVATTTQLSRTVETLRLSGQWTEPESLETLLRPWHVEGLAVRPSHRMVGHTGFLVLARRLAPGTQLPARRTRPAKGAYGADWKGPAQGNPQHDPSPQGGQSANPR